MATTTTAKRKKRMEARGAIQSNSAAGKQEKKTKNKEPMGHVCPDGQLFAGHLSVGIAPSSLEKMKSINGRKKHSSNKKKAVNVR